MHGIEHKIIDLVEQELGLAPGSVHLGTTLADAGDSLDWVNLLDAVEAEFDLRIGAAESLALDSVADLVRLACRHAGIAWEPAHA
jgi:acyl carrier protein